MNIELESIVRRLEDHISAEVNDELVVLSVEHGKYFGFDDIAQTIWERIQTPISVNMLCKDLAEQFDGDSEIIRKDVLDFLNKLYAEGIIVLEP